MNAAVIVAAGSGRRMGAGINKVFLPLLGEPVIVRTVRAFASSGLFGSVVVVTGADDLPAMEKLMAEYGLSVRLCAGGADRQESVRRGLEALPADTELAAVHDGARPLVTREIILRTLESARSRGSGVAAVPLKDTVKRVTQDGLVAETPDRATLRAVQTPQTFPYAAIRAAHEAHRADSARATDDAALLEADGLPVCLTEGSPENIKVTTPEDMDLAERILLRREGREKGEKAVRIGHGYDVHRLTEGRRLILCGVEVPYALGLLGHSDADVALHALMDALLGAAALGDIGRHFPDTDERYRGADSGELLDRVVALLKEADYAPVNADVTIICQRPKLATYIPAMRENVARHLGIPADCVNVKATTTERLGFEGEGLGISSHAVCLIGKEARCGQ